MAIYVRLNSKLLTDKPKGLVETQNCESARYSFLGKTFGYYDGYLSMSIGENDYFPKELEVYVIEATTKLVIPSRPLRENGKYVVANVGVVEVTETSHSKTISSIHVFIKAKNLHNLKKLREMIFSGRITPTVSYEADQKDSAIEIERAATIAALKESVEKSDKEINKLRDLVAKLIQSKWFSKDKWLDLYSAI